MNANCHLEHHALLLKLGYYKELLPEKDKIGPELYSLDTVVEKSLLMNNTNAEELIQLYTKQI